ncbi:DUF3987 domain-containing protein [Paludisphaera sp.]|uniref:DUF3987 domain-containing protein n=1 Tax=Paludisphaera sp. TaxID=2017432 RepID=UPI00301BFA7C
MSATPYDAACLAKLLAAQTLNGELAGVSDRYRPLAERLNTVPGPDRQAFFDQAMAFSWSDEEAAALTRSIADVDPRAPVAHAAADDWGPILGAELPPVDPFPIDVYPASVAEFVRTTAHSIGCPVDFPGLFALTAAAGAIGRSVSLKLKDGYFARSAIYACVVGEPGDGKTAALNKAAGPIRHAEEALKADFKAEIERWKLACNPTGPPPKQKTPKPPKPRRRRLAVDDATIESLIVRMANNPRGLVMVRDELSGLFAGMNQYKGGKGNDRSVILKIWSGDAVQRDRVLQESDDSIDIPFPMMSIMGGTQPDMLDEMVDAKGRADGFVDRFLFSFPDPVPWSRWSKRGVPEDVEAEWKDVIGRLFARPMNFKDGRDVPHVAFFSSSGEEAWERLHNAHVAEVMSPGFQPSMVGPWAKFKEYAGRLALVLALLEHAADPAADPMVVPDVDERHVESAWKLVGYFKGNARRVFAALARGSVKSEGRAMQAVKAWIRSKPRTTFTASDVKDQRRWIEYDDLLPTLDRLCRLNFIRPVKGAKTGRPSKASFEVNPAVYNATPTSRTGA